MARRSNGGMSLPDEIRPEAIRPTASPVDTYARPDGSAVDEQVAKAKYLEGALTEVERPLTKLYNQTMEQRDKEAKLRAVVDAQGTFIKWAAANEQNWSTLSSGQFHEAAKKKFDEDFANVSDPLMAYALQGEFAQYTGREGDRRLKAEQQLRDDTTLDNFIVGRVAELRKLHEAGASQEQADAVLEETRRLAKDMLIPVDKVFTRLLDAQVAALDNIKDRTKANKYIFNWFTKKNPSGGSLADTNRYEYNVRLDKIRNVLDKPTKEEFEIAQNEVFKGAAAHIENGSSMKTFDAWVDTQVKTGMMTAEQAYSFRNHFKTETDKRFNAAARQAVVNQATAGFVMGSTVLTDRTYKKADGTVGTVSKAELESTILADAKRIIPPEQHGTLIYSKIADPAMNARLVTGYNSMSTIYTDPQIVERKLGDGSKVQMTRSMSNFLDAVEIYQKLKLDGGDAAVNLQLNNAQAKEAFEDYLTIKSIYGNETQAIEMVKQKGNYSVDQKVLNAAVNDTMNTSNWFIGLFTGDKDAENSLYAKEKIKLSASRIMQITGLPADKVVPGVVEKFKETHFQVKGGTAYMPWTPEMQVSFGTKENFSAAANSFVEDYKKQWVEDGKAMGEDRAKFKVTFSPDPYRPNHFIIRTEDGAFINSNLNPQRTVTTETIKRWYLTKQTNEANKARGK